MRQNSENVSPMSNEGRNSYVLRHLTEALLALLADKPLHEISVSELCGKAGVGRASFYRNFESKEDILITHIDRIFHEWLDAYKQHSDMPISELIRAVFTHLEKHGAFYRVLNERGLIYLIKDVIVGSFGPKQEQSNIEAYASAFVSYSLYGWIEVWFQRGMQESAEEMATLFKNQGL